MADIKQAAKWMQEGKRVTRNDDYTLAATEDDDDLFSVHCFYEDGEEVVHTLFTDDLLADDWEIEEKKVEITRSQFFAAVDRALEIHQSDGTFNPMSVRLAQELGLE